jgi:glucose-6-phosphate 1-dehydrogenase
MLPSSKRTDGYERLLLDAIKGNLTLFVSRLEQEAAWKWVEPIMTTWESMKLTPKSYTAGSWGPISSTSLLARDNSSWHEELE